MEATSTQPTAKKEKKGLSRLWKRVRTAFRNKEITPASTSAPTDTAPSNDTQGTPKLAQDATKAAPEASEPPPPAAIAVETTEATAPTETPMQTDVDRRLARARELFKKYDFEIDESEWKAAEGRPAKPTERVQKTIRMRVRYTCHTCNTTFGHDKVCISCQHPRCTKCIRYPPRKAKDKRKQAASAAPIDPKAPNNKCACHECQTGFEIGAEECPNCHHKICERCLKEALIAVSPPPIATEPEKKPAPSEQPATDPVPTVTS